LSFYEGVLKIEESESEVLKIEASELETESESELLCTDSTVLVSKYVSVLNHVFFMTMYLLVTLGIHKSNSPNFLYYASSNYGDVLFLQYNLE
jgi:hypothetical protein